MPTTRNQKRKGSAVKCPVYNQSVGLGEVWLNGVGSDSVLCVVGGWSRWWEAGRRGLEGVGV